MPSKFRQAIRLFCVQRPLSPGGLRQRVYAFNPVDAQTGAVHEGESRLVVWLRGEKGDVYNDFRIMVDKLKPPYLRVACGAATSEEAATMEFLQGRTPLWPVV